MLGAGENDLVLLPSQCVISADSKLVFSHDPVVREFNCIYWGSQLPPPPHGDGNSIMQPYLTCYNNVLRKSIIIFFSAASLCLLLLPVGLEEFEEFLFHRLLWQQKTFSYTLFLKKIPCIIVMVCQHFVRHQILTSISLFKTTAVT